jgi:hypothetical protein
MMFRPATHDAGVRGTDVRAIQADACAVDHGLIAAFHAFGCAFLACAKALEAVGDALVHVVVMVLSIMSSGVHLLHVDLLYGSPLNKITPSNYQIRPRNKRGNDAGRRVGI